ncbi:MAG: peptide deformylase [Bacteroidia bacterium]|jgi:peptide deformylase|nr:peptide deformylase [Bacteroidia bacterium]
MKRLAFLLILMMGAAIISAQPPARSERKLIAGGKPDEKMRVTLVTNPDDLLVLRAVSAKVDKPEHRMWELLSRRMIATVQHPDHKGVGIAAPQVGINRQLIVVQRFDKDEKPFEVYFNPQITAYSDSLHLRAEGCLSIPGMRDMVERPWGIQLKYQDQTGVWREEYVEGFTARIFQHEIDHLNGVLFTDKIFSGK